MKGSVTPNSEIINLKPSCVQSGFVPDWLYDVHRATQRTSESKQERVVSFVDFVVVFSVLYPKEPTLKTNPILTSLCHYNGRGN